MGGVRLFRPLPRLFLTFLLAPCFWQNVFFQPALNGRQSPHSGVGEDILVRRSGFFFTKTALTRKQKIEKPQSPHEHLIPSTAALPPKITAYSRGWNRISNQSFFLQVGDIYRKYILPKKNGGEISNVAAAWPKQSAPLYMRSPPPTILPN